MIHFDNSGLDQDDEDIFKIQTKDKQVESTENSENFSLSVKKEKYFDIGTTESGTKELKTIVLKNNFPK